MATTLTTATPIIRAEAVAAVRRGRRTEFSLARVPVTPNIVGRGAPMIRALRRATRGARTVTPRKTMKAPRPTSDKAFTIDPNSPRARITAPIVVRMVPATSRLVSDFGPPMVAWLIAATGGIRAA